MQREEIDYTKLGSVYGDVERWKKELDGNGNGRLGVITVVRSLETLNLHMWKERVDSFMTQWVTMEKLVKYFLTPSIAGMVIERIIHYAFLNK